MLLVVRCFGKNVVRVIRIFDAARCRLASMKDNVFSDHQIFFFIKLPDVWFSSNSCSDCRHMLMLLVIVFFGD